MTTVTLLAAHLNGLIFASCMSKTLGPYRYIFEALDIEIQHLTFKEQTVHYKTLHWDVNQITNYVLLKIFFSASTHLKEFFLQRRIVCKNCIF